MGVGETFHWAPGDADRWESLSQTLETGPHPASSLSLCPSLSFCFILCLSFILTVPLSDYLFFPSWCLSLSFPLIHPTATSAPSWSVLVCLSLNISGRCSRFEKSRWTRWQSSQEEGVKLRLILITHDIAGKSAVKVKKKKKSFMV